MTDIEGTHSSSHHDFVHETHELTHRPSDETLTAAEVAAIYRAGFNFALETTGLQPLHAVLFAMSYGGYVLGRYNQRQSMLIIHEHEGQQPFEEEIPLPAARKASESAIRYLRARFSPNRQEHDISLTRLLRDRYAHEGVHPNPIDDMGRLENMLSSTFIFAPETPAEQFNEQLQQLRLEARPTFLAYPDRYDDFHTTQTDYALAEFDRILGEVETGEYLLVQEGIEPSNRFNL